AVVPHGAWRARLEGGGGLHCPTAKERQAVGELYVGAHEFGAWRHCPCVGGSRRIAASVSIEEGRSPTRTTLVGSAGIVAMCKRLGRRFEAPRTGREANEGRLLPSLLGRRSVLHGSMGRRGARCG